jgi:hypothetical protein
MERTDATKPVVAETEPIRPPQQTELPPELLNQLREVIVGGKWRYAHAPYVWPYWYRTPLLEDPVGYIDVARLLTVMDAIDAFGYDGHFSKRPTRYLNVDGWRYFSVGFDPNDPIQGCINRAKLPGVDQAAIRGDDPVDERGVRIRSSSESPPPPRARESPPEDDPEAHQGYRDALTRFLDTQDGALRAMVEPEDFSLRVIRRFQLDIPAETLAEIRNIIATSTWNFAKTMPWIPHFYIVSDKTVPYELLMRFAILLRHFGYDENYGSRIHRYLDVDEFKYWTMGEPIAETTLINRARLAPHAASSAPMSN